MVRHGVDYKELTYALTHNASEVAVRQMSNRIRGGKFPLSFFLRALAAMRLKEAEVVLAKPVPSAFQELAPRGRQKSKRANSKNESSDEG
uniref:DUF6471 domain-containing protein n=1 Tax=Derxia lacustris TaxID=764842 RepID=UPI0038B34753